jgi:hypothetical protein
MGKWKAVLTMKRKDLAANLKEKKIPFHPDSSIAELRSLWWPI